MRSYFFSKKAGYELSQDQIKIQLGNFADNIYLIELFKIQSIELKRSPFQLRNDLTSIEIQTASGRVTIPYLKSNEAQDLRDYILYKVESSDLNWM